jgi:YegS/Rv2252/BmrU family lipid kinase
MRIDRSEAFSGVLGPAGETSGTGASGPRSVTIRSALVIFNPTAGGRRRRRLDKVVARLKRAGIAVDLTPTTAAGHAEELARAATVGSDRPDVVIAAGGDGTINEVVNGLAGSDVALALLPMGTANVLAAEIGLAISSRAIVDAILNGHVRPIHLGEANGRRFTLMAGVGLDADVVATVDPWLKRMTGKFAYVVATYLRWMEYRRRRFRVLIDGEEHSAAAAIVANGHYYAGKFVCAPEARITDPNLYVCLFEKPGRWQALYYMMALFFGFLDRLRTFRVVKATDVAVLDHSGPVQSDGDIIARAPVRIRVSPQTVSLLVPQATRA